MILHGLILHILQHAPLSDRPLGLFFDAPVQQLRDLGFGALAGPTGCTVADARLINISEFDGCGS